MQHRVPDTFFWILLLFSLGLAGCPSIVEETQRKQEADENSRLESDRTKIDKEIDRNQYKTEKAYRQAYEKLLQRHANLAEQYIDSARYQYLYGYLLVEKSKKVEQFTKCLRIKEDHFPCLVARGLVYADWGVENFATRDFDKAKQLQPDSLEPVIGMATLAFRKKQNQKAIALYQQVLQKQSQNKGVLFSLALLYDREQDWNQAVAFYQKVLKLDNKDFSSWEALARIHFRLKQYTQAAHAMEQAIAIREQFRLIVQLAGLYETELSNPTRALELYEKASTMPQGHFHTFYRLGVLRAGRGETANAIQALEKAVQLRNDNSDAFYQLAELLAREGRHKDAISWYWKSIQLDGKQSSVRLSLASSLIKTGDYTTALQQYQEILNMDPKNQNARTAMNSILNQLGLTNDTFSAKNNGQVIRKGESILQRCYNHRLKEKPGLKGNVAIAMIVASDGKVERVNIVSEETTLLDPLVQTCAKWTFRRAIFPFIKNRSRLRYTIKLHK